MFKIVKQRYANLKSSGKVQKSMHYKLYNLNVAFRSKVEYFGCSSEHIRKHLFSI